MSCCDNKPDQGQQSGLKSWVSGPRRMWLLSAVVVAGGLALGWDQLVLLGVAPLLVSLLPCLVMCGLGLCIMKCKDKKGKPADQNETATQQTHADVSPDLTKKTF